jgi:hypothetical protein
MILYAKSIAFLFISFKSSVTVYEDPFKHAILGISIWESGYEAIF